MNKIEEHKAAMRSIIESRQPIGVSELWAILESVMGEAFDADDASDALDDMADAFEIEEDRSGNWWLAPSFGPAA